MQISTYTHPCTAQQQARIHIIYFTSSNSTHIARRKHNKSPFTGGAATGRQRASYIYTYAYTYSRTYPHQTYQNETSEHRDRPSAPTISIVVAGGFGGGHQPYRATDGEAAGKTLFVSTATLLSFLFSCIKYPFIHPNFFCTDVDRCTVWTGRTPGGVGKGGQGGYLT